MLDIIKCDICGSYIDPFDKYCYNCNVDYSEDGEVEIDDKDED